MRHQEQVAKYFNRRRWSAAFKAILAGIKTIGIAIVVAGFLHAAKPQQESEFKPATVSQYSAILNRYCITCHNEKLKTADLMLNKMDIANVPAGAEVWEKVIRKLRSAAMPPAGLPRPDKSFYESFATYLETELDRAATAKPNPGRPAIHRLNRAEYANAIRDLIGLEIDAESLLPADEPGYGFDNNGDVLNISPLLLGRYMSAARQISRLAVGDPRIRMFVSTYDVPQLRLQDDRMSENLPFGSRGGIAIRHKFPLDGDYLLKIRLQRSDDGANILGLGERHQLEVLLNGARIKLFSIGNESGIPGSLQHLKPEEVEAGLEVRFPAKAGTSMVGVTFRDENLSPVAEGMLRQPFAREDTDESKRDPGVASVAIAGPYDAKGAGDTPSRQKIFVCHPTGDKDEEFCAKRILFTLARRAYRRPITDGDVQPLLKFYRAGRAKGGFDAGVQMALEEMLVMPEFLFRVEADQANVAGNAPYRIGDLELASRLSFFLWSSIPDDQLLSLAERGKLRNSEVLEQQVQRMLHDARSKALVDNFAGQWLYLRSMRSALPDKVSFPDYDESLRDAFEQEIGLFFESMLRENRSVIELLDANYTFVNERLARHYGIPNIYGSHFRRVKLTDANRWGLLGKGGILMVTSYPTRTSPVLRGKWVLENILGTPPPPPPPNVPSLKDRNDDGEFLTVRQRMEQHRANPACSICHSRMDPLGFAMDNFDAIGKWRTTEANKPVGNAALIENPIDTSGALPDGTIFQGPAGLRKILLTHPEQFVTTITEKLLTYALGRGVEYYDQPAIREILREVAPSNYQWSALILAIVKSPPFQMRMSVERTTAAGLR